MTESFLSWGRVFRPPQHVVPMASRDDVLSALMMQAGADAGASPSGAKPTLLPYGNGRSYGDSNLNAGGILLDVRPLNRFIEFDDRSGVLTCEAGVLLSQILMHCVPQGWFPATTPGTQFVTVGGAIANDVHGKNHHRAGSFGNHVLRFELLRSDGTRLVCSPEQNANWFAATIGGLGLTGVITWATLQLRPIANPYVDTETIRFRSLEEFFELSAESEAGYEYSVSWIDCAFSGRRLGRGLFNRGNHASAGLDLALVPPAQRARAEVREHRVPFSPPFSLINSLTLKAFNLAYFHRQRGDSAQLVQHYRPFFYPLDALLEWNRIYGPKGFYQYQCVVPDAHALRSMRQLLGTIASSGMGSFLAVIKQFGTPPSRGMLSFPTPGTTLALDFPNRGARLHRLFEALDRIVLEAGGRLYPAKDGRMGPTVFKLGYPRWEEFLDYVDPRFSSSFWRRVMVSY
jgi:FAD/FMN-containing dehydrogenase